MLVRINPKIAGKIEEFLKLTDVVYTRNGSEFEIPSATNEGFVLGRYYQQTLTNYNNEAQLSEKEKSDKN